MANDERFAPTMLNGLDDSRCALLDLFGGLRRALVWYTPLIRPGCTTIPTCSMPSRKRVVDQPSCVCIWCCRQPGNGAATAPAGAAERTLDQRCCVPRTGRKSRTGRN